MPKIPGINHLRAVRALEKGGFRIVRQGKHIVMSDGSHFITIPRHNPVNALTMGGIVKDAGMFENLRTSYADNYSTRASRTRSAQSLLPSMSLIPQLH